MGVPRISSRFFVDRASAEAHYLDAIDEYVGAIRARFITAVPGQAETYQAKGADADAFLASESPDLVNHPWVAAEARATGVTPSEAALAIVAQRDEWIVLGSALEELRIRAKTEIRTAQSSREMQTTLNNTMSNITAVIADTP